MPVSKRLAVARRLVEEHRLSLFPLRAGGKLPAIRGWQEAATVDAAALEKWFGKGERNIGVATGPSGLIVIDTDQKEGRDGDANFRALAGAHGADLDATFTVESPTGSRHYYFRGDPVRDSVGKLADAVDIRSKGGLVVAPGSTTANGVYRVINNVAIAAIPQWLIETIAQKYVQADKVELLASVDLDTPAAYSTALAFLGEADASVEGHGGNDNAYRIACRLKDLGISEAGALDCMDLLSDWNTRCVPPWERDELAEVIEHAYSYGENSIGSASVELEFDDIPDDLVLDLQSSTALSTNKVFFLTDAEIKSGKGKRRQYVIKGVLSVGDIAILFGKPGAGKSLIGPYLARMIAQGKLAFGRRTKQGGVFYVAAEDPTGMTERVEALQMRFGDAPGFELVIGVNNLAADKSPDVKALLLAAKGRRPVLIIIDTQAMAFPGIDENSAEGMGRVVQVARALTRHGAAVILIHHDTKAEGDTPRGHSVLDGAADMTLKLIRNETSGVISGKQGKNRNGPPDWAPAFRIGVAELGTDEDGDPITAAYADEINAPVGRPREKLSSSTQAAFDILAKLDAGTGVDRAAWRDACCGDISAMSAADDIGDRQRVFRRALQELLARERIEVRGKTIVIMGSAAEDFERFTDDPIEN